MKMSFLRNTRKKNNRRKTLKKNRGGAGAKRKSSEISPDKPVSVQKNSKSKGNTTKKSKREVTR